jgi:hypothetical protein
MVVKRRFDPRQRLRPGVEIAFRKRMVRVIGLEHDRHGNLLRIRVQYVGGTGRSTNWISRGKTLNELLDSLNNQN